MTDPEKIDHIISNVEILWAREIGLDPMGWGGGGRAINAAHKIERIKKQITETTDKEVKRELENHVAALQSHLDEWHRK